MGVPFAFTIDNDVNVLGTKLLTYAVQLSIAFPFIYDVTDIGSDGWPVGGDIKLFIEKLNDDDTDDENIELAVTEACTGLPVQRKLDITFYIIYISTDDWLEQDIAEFMGIKLVVEISLVHLRLVGNCTVTEPPLGIAF